MANVGYPIRRPCALIIFPGFMFFLNHFHVHMHGVRWRGAIASLALRTLWMLRCQHVCMLRMLRDHHLSMLRIFLKHFDNCCDDELRWKMVLGESSCVNPKNSQNQLVAEAKLPICQLLPVTATLKRNVLHVKTIGTAHWKQSGSRLNLTKRHGRLCAVVLVR